MEDPLQSLSTVPVSAPVPVPLVIPKNISPATFLAQNNPNNTNTNNDGDTNTTTTTTTTTSTSNNKLPIDIPIERIEESSNASNAAKTTILPIAATKSESKFSFFKKTFKKSSKRYSIEQSIPAVTTIPPEADDHPTVEEEEQAPLSPTLLQEEPITPNSPYSNSNVPPPLEPLNLNNASSSFSAPPSPGGDSISDKDKKERTGSLRKSLVRRFSFGRTDKEEEKNKEKEKEKESEKKTRARRLSSSSQAFLGPVGSSSLSTLASADNPDIKFFDNKLKALFKKGIKQAEKLTIIQELIPVLRMRAFDYGTTQWSRLVIAGSLLECWRFLLKNVSGATYEARAFYFRAIVLIMKRHELRLHEFTDDPEGNLAGLYSEYSKLIWETNTYVLERLGRKGVYVSLLGFSMEVLAINYFLMPTLASQILQVLEQAYQESDPELDSEVNDLVLEIKKKDEENGLQNKFKHLGLRRISSANTIGNFPVIVEPITKEDRLGANGHLFQTFTPLASSSSTPSPPTSISSIPHSSSMSNLHGAAPGSPGANNKGLDLKPVSKGPWLDKFHFRKEPEFFLMFFKTFCRRIIEINVPTVHGSHSALPISSGSMGLTPSSSFVESSLSSSPSNSTLASSLASLSSSPSNNSLSSLSSNMSTTSGLSTSPSSSSSISDLSSGSSNSGCIDEESSGTESTRQSFSGMTFNGSKSETPDVDWFSVRGYTTFIKSFSSLALSLYFPPDVKETMFLPPPLFSTPEQITQHQQQLLQQQLQQQQQPQKKSNTKSAVVAGASPVFFSPDLMVVFENPHMISMMAKIFMRKTSVTNIRAVTCMMSFVHDMISHYCHLQARPLPSEFDSEFFTRALRMLFESHHYVVLMATLSFLYRHMQVFSESCRQTITNMLATRFFFKFFLHWQGSVRWFFYHILLYRMLPFNNLKSIEEFISLQATGPEQFSAQYPQWCAANMFNPYDYQICKKMHENTMCIRARYTMLVTLVRSAMQAQQYQQQQQQQQLQQQSAGALSSSPSLGYSALPPPNNQFQSFLSGALTNSAAPPRPPVFSLDFDVDSLDFDETATPTKNLDAHCTMSGCKLGDIARALKEYIDCQAENIKWIRERIAQGMLPSADELHLAFPKLLLKLPNMKGD